VVSDGRVVDVRREQKTRAGGLIEDFMMAANGVVARFLAAAGVPGLRRVVRSPERWDRLEALARGYGDRLPPDPDGAALAGFLARRRAADPLRFPDLSLAVVKLLGAGEYVLFRPGQDDPGHFGLAVREYVHSTAPNRRFPDLVTQRLVGAALASAAVPYSDAELAALATHCTEQENAAEKVDALVTGASDKGTWVRTLAPPVEGRVVRGERGLDVGDRLRVRLDAVDVDRGYIDFARVG
jgi:exoribonuclease-2